MNESGVTGTGDRRPIAARGLPLFVGMADWLARRRVSPNEISLAGMACGVLAGVAFALVHWRPDLARLLWVLGAVLVQLRLLANMLDGMVAIGRGVASPLGALFNDVPDRVSDTAVLVGVGLAATGGWAWGLAAALAAMTTAYVRVTGASLGAASDFCGPMAKPHRMNVVTVLAIWCAVVPARWGTASALPAWVLAAITLLAVVTAIRRLRHIAAALRAAGPR
jgi:phosphatidylglycerophosphate synthase